MRCMPWPLAVFCWLDDISHARHRDGSEATRLACRAHDRVMTAWWHLLPRSEAKFDRRVAAE